MRNAKLLSLVGQNLAEVPDIIYDNAKEAEVTCVDLSRNKIQELTDGLGGIVTATDLKLSYNLLTEIPDWLGLNLQKLRYLDLSKNLLNVLPASLSSLRFLIELNISFNKYFNFIFLIFYRVFYTLIKIIYFFFFFSDSNRCPNACTR